MRKFFFIFGLWLGLVPLAAKADNFTLTDGASVTGDIVKFDDHGLMLRTGDTYTNLSWARFSQPSLKQLSANEKIAPQVEPFIEPDDSQRPSKPEIKIGPVTRLERPAHPSIIGGMFKSSVGLFILFILYLANLYAAFEIAVIRARPLVPVIGLSAVLPVIGPIIFLSLPKAVEAPEEEIEMMPAGTPGAPATPGQPLPEIQITEASWKQEEKKPEPQVFARGKFTFNKRFIETKFGAFTGTADGPGAKNFTMQLKTTREQFTVERIANVGATDVLLETTQRGQITVPLADIQEVKLIPKTA